MTCTAYLHDGPADGEMLQLPEAHRLLFMSVYNGPSLHDCKRGETIECETVMYEKVSEATFQRHQYVDYDYVQVA